MKVEIRKKWFGKYSLLLLAVIIFVSCQKKDIDRFDTATDYIYFDIPYQLNKNRRIIVLTACLILLRWII